MVDEQVCPECKKPTRWITNCSDGQCCRECRDCNHKVCWPKITAEREKELIEENDRKVMP